MEPITEEEVRRIIENDEQKIQKIIDEGGQVTKTIVENQKQIITGLKHFWIAKNSKSIENAYFFCQIFSKSLAYILRLWYNTKI